MLLALLPLTALAAAPEVGVSIEPLIAVDMQRDGTEDHTEAWTWIRAQASQRTEAGRWFLAVQADHNMRFGEDSEGIWSMRVGESGWAGSVGPAYTRVGVLIERWGKLDLLPTLSIMNPADLRAGPLSTVEAAQVPVPMATVQVGSDTLRVELSYAPFPEGDRVKLVGSDWSLVRPGMLEEALKEVPQYSGADNPLLAEPIANLAAALSTLDARTQRGLTSALEESGQPESFGLRGNVGARLEWEGPGIDAALMGANIQSPIPETQLAPAYRSILADKALPSLDQLSALTTEDPLTTAWPRTWVAGAELSTLVGPFGLRAEGVWWSDRVVQQTWLRSTTVPSTATGFGIDYAQGSTFFLAMEARWTHHLDDVADPFLTRQDVVEAGLLARMSLANERLQINAASIGNWTFRSWLARPEVRYVVDDALSLGVGAVIIGAESEAPADLQSTLSHPSGPLSLLQDNDAVFVTMRWTQ